MQRRYVLNIILIIAMAVSVSWSSCAVYAEETNDIMQSDVVQTENQPIYRLYSNVNGEHLYTTSEEEVRILCAQHFWAYEGVAWFAPTGGTPVYRLYNSVLQNHLYTTDLNEINILTTEQGWTFDNNRKPLFYSGGAIGIYRLYNMELRGLHLWTTDGNEYKELPSHGWRQEGITLFGAEQGNPNYAYPSGDVSIEDTDSEYAIEADVTLTGTGTGYHAKLVACTALSAVSYGLQFDTCAVAPYTNKTALIVENIADNDPGGQRYSRTGYADTNRSYHLMMTVQKNGKCDFYFNGTWAGSVTNTYLADQALFLRVEGSGRKNGDTLNARFDNIKIKRNGIYEPGKIYGIDGRFITNAGLKVDSSLYYVTETVTVLGEITELRSDQDWDNAYNNVSGIAQFAE